MGVSVRTVKRMTAAGMPSETWGMGHTRRYLPSRGDGLGGGPGYMIAANPPERRANAARADQRRR